MSSRRKITVSSSSMGSRRSRSAEKEHQSLPRPSVFSRLGTKRSPSSSSNLASKSLSRNAPEVGSSHYGKYVGSHKLGIRQRDDPKKGRKRLLHGSSPKVDTDWENWNQESLDYEDEKMLEKKRLLLQKELAKEHQDPAKTASKVQVAKSSSPSTSSSSTSSSGSDSSSKASSTPSKTDSRKKRKKGLSKRKVPKDPNSSASDDGGGPSKSSGKREKSKALSKKVKTRGRVSKKELKKKNRRSKDGSGSKKRSPSRSSTSKVDEREKPAPSIVDKFGFYHSQQPTSAHDGLAKHGASKKAASPERRQQSPQPERGLKRKRRSSGSPPRKRRSSPPSKSKPSYVAATSRSGGNLGKGQDRDLRAERLPPRTQIRKRPSLSPQRQRKKMKGHKKPTITTGANNEPVENRRNVRRPISPGERGLRRNRSRSNERLLPPQALLSKKQTQISKTPISAEGRKKSPSRERSEPTKSPVLAEQSKSHEGSDLSAEDFSEIGESDEDFIQNKEEVEKEDEKELVEENVSAHDMSEDKLKESDLLEGISEEELDVSDEDKDQKVKIADALGVDWSQLISQPKEKKDANVSDPGSFRKQWTPAAIFSRIGLPKNLLRPGQFEKVIQKVNEQGNGELEILDPNPEIHCYLMRQRETARKPNSKLCQPALSARTDQEFRRKLLGLPPKQQMYC